MIKKIFILLLIPTLLFMTSCGTDAKSSTKKAELISDKENVLKPITPETALERYLDNGDKTFKWEIKENYPVGENTAYDILFTSQKWREHIWTHQLTVIVPKEINYEGALLFITGGSSTGDLPNWKAKDDKTTKNFAAIATKNKALVAIVRQTPKQPLYDGLVEDQLISFTLHNFKNDKDYSWPLLFPMVKSAVKAMDAIQEFSKEKLNKDIKRFTVSGASKRGWTTWLTGSQDKRVEAIAPMVIDVLNMPVSLDYQLTAWNEYSIQIEDYTKLEIPQQVATPEGNAITLMIDPYSYREKLTMPKLIFIGTNDEYWPVDAVKNYINEIPGENYIHYVPNAGHDLAGGEQAFRALSGFWERTLNNKSYKEFSYKTTADKNSVNITIKSSPDELLNVYLWSTDSKDRDFRDEKWISKKLKFNKEGLNHKVKFPKNGYRAFYIDMEYADPNGGKYTKSTRMYLLDDDELL